ncbi:HlyD family type I secretion periplasmic adaptor subunit [Pseudoalteromonas sp. SWXJZ94C]|uniref:HlyD family type I secretion periplasmic adaptor subunit n=1 Tax=unclassified Pseudoalteromonas TaxID=194690 RepID=UPI0004255CE3|nr:MULTISPECIES: HlyD family type I secretion periplasmic adaptor subunit [unclassified Pseudoalteromonas]MBH0057809.1 HlyD family type I secretion periplasmic adaptor subunit [Pseudoalteromonas sp. SWXJZ94C]
MADLYMGQLQAAKQAKRLVIIVFVLLFTVVLWAKFAKLEEVVVGQGAVIPVQRVQTIENLDGGILKEVLVKEGQLVEVGDPLLLIDETRFAAAYAESNQELTSLLARRNRLVAELKSVVLNDKSSFGADIDRLEIPRKDITVDVYKQAYNTYTSRLTQLESQLQQRTQNLMQQEQASVEQRANISALKQNLKLIAREVLLTQGAVDAGAVAEMELVKLQRDEIAMKGELNQANALLQQLKAAKSQVKEERKAIVFDYLADSQNQLDEVSNELAKIQQSSKSLEDRLIKAQVRSPVRGTVKNIVSRSIGSVIDPGEVMMEIVPQNDLLLIDTKIQPKDIGFIRVGMKAKVKFTAYDFVIYGGLEGEVTYIGADAQYLEDGTAYYQAYIKTTISQIAEQPIIPGMQTQVDVITGKKTVLDYWLKPLLRAKANAMREP